MPKVFNKLLYKQIEAFMSNKLSAKLSGFCENVSMLELSSWIKSL